MCVRSLLLQDRTGTLTVLRRDSRGAALVEFALVLPVFLAMLTGIVAYGGYFWRAHALQQVANDAARAAVAGLTATERQALALAAARTEMAQLAGLDPAQVQTTVSEDGGLVTVRVAYDARHDAFLNMTVLPMPSTTILRTAAVRNGGL
jgi:Flp pilus assembly protein TadG